MSAAPMLELDRVSMHFPVKSAGLLAGKVRTVKAVDDVSFTMRAGETLALVGESGCGKTTTAKLILRLLEPTAGRVLVDGTDIATLKGAALRRFRTKVQAVFQDPWASLNPRMRARDIIAEPLLVNERLTTRECQRRVDEVIEAVGLRVEQARNFPHEFSGGQRQRIAIASALVGRPELIVLDEPVSALDVSIRSQIMNLFKDLQGQYGVGYVLVAHDLGTTRYMADWIAVMYLGRIVELGPSEILFDDPQHPYTQALLSAALPSHPRIDHQEIVLAGEVPSPIDPPAGCAFHPRCQSRLGQVCASTTPPLDPMRDGRHRVACHIHATAQAAAAARTR
jgi:peptide/nickel transport system ATP-binding protein/oligopeptide transport system ATP-binding protein